MAEHPDAAPHLVDAAVESYGGRALAHATRLTLSPRDLRTDLSDVVAAVVSALPTQRQPTDRRRQDRRRSCEAYGGPERRQSADAARASNQGR